MSDSSGAGTLRVPGASISLQSARKDYGSVTVLKDIDLEVAEGEFMTLLGPSGSGKSTTLGLIAGFTELTQGALEIDRVDVRSVPMYKRGIGVVFQNYALFPHMTVAENVGFPLKQRRVSKAETAERVEQALRTVRMTELASRYPGELSGGQQQRVAFARAIVFRPRVLLMDEPLGALDKKLREWLQLEIRRIHAEVGSTFVYVTHDQDEALSMSDRITVFNEGRIEQIGTPAELYAAPATLFVAQFVGESTTLKGRGTAAGEGVVRVSGPAGEWLGPKPEGFIEGEATSLLVRPENISLLPPGGSTGDSDFNSAEVVITDVVFLGNGFKCTFAFGDGSEGLLRVGQQAPLPVQVGDRATVEWRVADGIVLQR